MWIIYKTRLIWIHVYHQKGQLYIGNHEDYFKIMQEQVSKM